MKIDFEFETLYGMFRDALHLPDDHTYTNEEIEAMKLQRRDNWIAIVTAPSQETIETATAIASDTMEIGGETYKKLEGAPQSGAKLIEVNGVWYYRM